MNCEAPSYIDVLIVGAGLGGLYAAIESHRQGHSVRVVESKNDLEAVGQFSFIDTQVYTILTRQMIGDFVGIGPSVTKQFQKWPGMAKTYSSIIYRPAMVLLTHDGTLIGGPFELSEDSDYRPVPVSRPKLIGALYDYAIALGIPIVFGKRVVEYGESYETNRAYCTTDKGERFEADVVVAADGVGTKVGKFMIGKEVKAISSGYSVYRVTYPTKLLQEDPFLAEQFSFRNGDPDYCEVFIGPNGNMIILVSPEITTWLFTHQVRPFYYLGMWCSEAERCTGQGSGSGELVYAAQLFRRARVSDGDRPCVGQEVPIGHQTNAAKFCYRL